MMVVRPRYMLHKLQKDCCCNEHLRDTYRVCLQLAHTLSDLSPHTQHSCTPHMYGSLTVPFLSVILLAVSLSAITSAGRSA
jgi:hypothetical protein